MQHRPIFHPTELQQDPGRNTSEGNEAPDGNLEASVCTPWATPSLAVDGRLYAGTTGRQVKITWPRAT